jgi:hypothetical protein
MLIAEKRKQTTHANRRINFDFTGPHEFVADANFYKFEMSNPVVGLDPMGLADQPTTQPTTKPIGTVKVKVINGRTVRFVYTGDGQPTFKQTVHIILPAGAGSSKDEIKEHGGKDSTQGPVGDNGAGDPNAPLGTDKDGNAANGYNKNGSNSKDGKSSSDSPGPGYIDDNGNKYRVRKEFVTTILDCNGNPVSVIHWHLEPTGLAVIDKQE